MIRTGYSFRSAVGSIEDVLSRIKEIGWSVAPVADRNSTFSFVRFDKAAKKTGLRPIYGVEIGVTPALGEKKQTLDYWTFLAKDNLQDVHALIHLATGNPGKEPSLTYKQAETAPGLFKITGDRTQLDFVQVRNDVFVGLSPATPRGLFRAAQDRGHKFVARSANVFPRADDREFYRILMGKSASAQTYPQHILSDDEWHSTMAWVPDEIRTQAITLREEIFSRSKAKIKSAVMLTPQKEKPLLEMCREGAAKLGVDLTSPVYEARLARELTVIQEKQFEDYFYIIADMVAWAKQHMIVGPARGSSCGSLVCYLLGITAIDPIPYDLIFERFIDTTRADLPDIDLDFSDARRHLVFEYAEKKYGEGRVARLGTVGVFQVKSALNQVGAALQIPRWVGDRVAETALDTLKETFEQTDIGKDYIEKYPEARVAERIEGHPNVSSQHAAGIVITQEPVMNYVAVDASTNSTMCDKKDAEAINLLKIDALGLTQLSIFERTLELMGKKPVSGMLEKIPLEDPRAFEVLNGGHFSGIFQFAGNALKGLVKQIKIESINDMVAITALARPGPMASGGAQTWIDRKNGKERVTYDHPLLEPILADTLGCIVYQEQVMRIGRELGGLSWEQVTGLRRAIGKSQGEEAVREFYEPWKEGALQRGVSEETARDIWKQILTFGSYGFNKSHAVAYGLVSYWCCWLKAYRPVEFAAATLDAEADPARQIAILRELQKEGVDYIPVDRDNSTARWEIVERDGKKILVGPLTSIKGLGPSFMSEILESRRKGKQLRPSLEKRLREAKTPIDTLTPIRTRIDTLHPDLSAIKILTEPTPVEEAQCGVRGDVVILGVLKRITPKNENSPENVEKRGGRTLTGPSQSLNMFIADDTDEVFCKIDRFNFEKLARPVLEKGGVGKSLYAIKGDIPSDFRMIKVKAIRYLGDIE